MAKKNCAPEAPKGDKPKGMKPAPAPKPAKKGGKK